MVGLSHHLCACPVLLPWAAGQALPDKVLALLACSTLVTAALWLLEFGVIEALNPQSN